MIKKILLPICIIISFQSLSQECGTLTLDGPKTYSSNSLRSSSSGVLCVDVQFHIVRNDNGSTAFNEPSVNDVLNELNIGFNEHNIFFNNVGSNFINDSDYVDVTSFTEFNQLGAVDNNSNAINFYIVHGLSNDGNAFAGVAGLGENYTAVVHSSAVTTTSVHEMGHVFELYHTHQTDFGVENINGNNCATAGDLVCDTPADPNLNGLVDLACNYTENDGYNPLTDNYMSYSRRTCRDDFTAGQANRMRNALLQNGELANAVTSSVNVSINTAEFEGGAFYVSAYATGGSAPFRWYINGQLIRTTSSRSFSHRYPCSTGSSNVGVVANTPCGGTTSDQAYYYEDCGSGGHKLSVYPNPTDAELNISFAQDSKDIESATMYIEVIAETNYISLTILDLTGNPVRKKEFKSSLKDMKMDVSDISKGIYLLRIVGNELDETHTIVIE